MGPSTTTRRKLLKGSTAIAMLSGCIGGSPERPGVVDANDIVFNQSSSGSMTFENQRKNNGQLGVKMTTNDTIEDATAISNLEVSVPNVSNSVVVVETDILEMDDDTELEFRFCGESVCRSIYAGNEFISKSAGVLATETGTGFEMEVPFNELPSSNESSEQQIELMQNIEFRVKDGDATFLLWTLAFAFDDYSIVTF